MYARLKHLLVTTALVGTTLTGTAWAGSALAGTGALSAMRSPGSGGRAIVHLAAKCKPDQIDACKPAGCCIVD